MSSFCGVCMKSYKKCIGNEAKTYDLSCNQLQIKVISFMGFLFCVNFFNILSTIYLTLIVIQYDGKIFQQPNVTEEHLKPSIKKQKTYISVQLNHIQGWF